MKAIPGYPGYYATEEGEIISKRDEPMSQMTNNTGHKVLKLCVEGKHKAVSVHSLIMLTFVGERPEGTEVCHIDGNPSNNRIKNLKYGTRGENLKDRCRHGSHNWLKLTREQTLEIHRLANEGILTQTEIANMYGISRQHVSKIKLEIRGTWVL